MRPFDLPPIFRTTRIVRDRLPDRRERCARRGSRTSRWWRSLREADREPIAAVAKRHGVSEQTRCERGAGQCRAHAGEPRGNEPIYTWRKRFGTFQADDVRRLKALEAENARLKKLVAERDLEIEVMKEIAAKNGERAGSP